MLRLERKLRQLEQTIPPESEMEGSWIIMRTSEGDEGMCEYEGERMTLERFQREFAPGHRVIQVRLASKEELERFRAEMHRRMRGE